VPNVSTSPSNPSSPFFPPPGVKLKDSTVNIRDVDGLLQSFLITAGLVHMHLFNMLLVVTSGKDGQHSPGSKHGTGKALDLRIADLASQDQPAFLLCLRVLCARFGLAMFDESNLPGAGHVHIEIAG
jgi:hypothetical protein